MTLSYPWQKLYEEAALEFDKEKLADRIRLAEEAISARLQELSRVDGNAGSERQTLAAAIAGLRVLQRECISPGQIQNYQIRTQLCSLCDCFRSIYGVATNLPRWVRFKRNPQSAQDTFIVIRN
jgi:hypothetical protein